MTLILQSNVDPASGMSLSTIAHNRHTSLTNHMLTISSVFRTCQAAIGWNQQQRFEVTKFAVHPLDSVGYANRNAKMEIIHAVHVFVKSVLFLLLWSKCEGRDSDLNYVTCGSLVKLLNTRHNVRLHSHDVKYGSGNFHNVYIQRQLVPTTAIETKRLPLQVQLLNVILKSTHLKMPFSAVDVRQPQHAANTSSLMFLLSDGFVTTKFYQAVFCLFKRQTRFSTCSPPPPYNAVCCASEGGLWERQERG